MKKLRIAVVGGSACSAIGLRDDSYAWPRILQKNTKCELTHVSIGGLTLVRSIKHLIDLPTCDILVLHFGTSIGWPVSLAEMQDKFRIKFSSEFGLHQPLRAKDMNFLKRLRKFTKQKIKNSIKYLLFFLGQYRPKVSIHEIEDQIDAVANVVHDKASHIIWIQHRVLQNSHTFVERLFYRRYYKKILSLVATSSSAKILSMPISEEFISTENYLSDWVHLSEIGHQRISDQVKDELKKLGIL